MPTDDAAVVGRLYAALAARDGVAVGQLIDDHFSADVVLHEPASLPWGGAHRGLPAVRRLFVGMTRAPAGTSPLDPSAIEVERLAGQAGEVAVLLRFPFVPAAGEPVESGAVEWFRFRDGQVTEIRAVYFDTAALVQPATTP
jgi:ketosteroid isomerase-like protein